MALPDLQKWSDFRFGIHHGLGAGPLIPIPDMCGNAIRSGGYHAWSGGLIASLQPRLVVARDLPVNALLHSRNVIFVRTLAVKSKIDIHQMFPWQQVQNTRP